MYFDLSISKDFNDFESLRSSKTDGFCLNFNIKGKNEYSKPKKINSDLKIYYRCTLDEIPRNIDLRSFYDVICLKTNFIDNKIIKYKPDLVKIDLKSIKYLKKANINILKKNDIFIELCINEILYENNIFWFSSLRRLLRLGASSILIISSGASFTTEIKEKSDICKILKLFDIREDKAYEILGNTKRLLRLAAIKKYTFKSLVSMDTEIKESLKNDFIDNYHKLN